MKKSRVAAIFIVIICLALGTLIYAITRSQAIYLNQWIGNFGEGKVLAFFQSLSENINFPLWIIYSLPDALWMFALIILVLTIWNFRLTRKSIPWIALAIAAGLIFEISQGFHFVGGTFDVTDLIFILAGAFLPISFMLIKSRICQAN